MKKCKTFIVDDEDAPITRLLELLKDYPKVIDLNSITIARSFAEAQNIILNGNTFDLSIIDKKLGGGKTCFDLITRQNKNAFGVIVLNSQDSESQMHFQDIKHIGGYLVLNKPYNYDDVSVMISEIISKNDIFESHSEFKLILLKDSRDKEIPVEQSKIIFLEVDGNYSRVFYQDGLETKKIGPIVKQLIDFQKFLNPALFERISDKRIVNINFIDSILDGTIIMKGHFHNDENVLPLPSRNKAKLLSRFSK